jgi:hypothetical protein
MTITTPDDASMIQRLMESFRAMCNDAIRIGLAADASSQAALMRLVVATHHDDPPSRCLEIVPYTEDAIEPNRTRNNSRPQGRDHQKPQNRLEILKCTAKTDTGTMSAEDGETDDDFEDDFEDNDSDDDDE